MGITRACLLPCRRPRASSISTRSYFVSAPRPLVLSLPSASPSSPASFNLTTSSSYPKRSQSTTPYTRPPSESNPLRPVWSIEPSKPTESKDVPELKSAPLKEVDLGSLTTKEPSSPSPETEDSEPPEPELTTPSPPASRSHLKAPPFLPPIPTFLSSSPDTLAAPSDPSSPSSSYAPPEDSQEEPYSYSSSSQPYHYIPTSLFGKDPAYQSLDAHLLTPTVHPDLFASQESLDRSDKIWEVYGTVVNHRSLPASTWTALLSNVVPPNRVASSMTGKFNEFGSTAKFGSAVLTNYLRRGYEERFHRIMQDKAKAGLEPLREEFRVIMEHFAPNGYVKGVESVFAAMVLKGIDPEPRDYELRLEAIVHWLRRYQSLEAESLIEEGVLHPFETALSSVPDLVGTIMTSLNSASFTPTLSRQTVDLACELLAQTGDAKAFNLLVRYEYGVDLDVPDAIPEEFLARMQQGEDVQRGLANAGLMSALKLWEKEGNFYKMLSMFEVFAYPLSMPPGTPKGLDRKPSWRSESAFVVNGKSYAPPLPPTTAVRMMSLAKVPVVASTSSSDPQPNLVDSEPTPSTHSSFDPTPSSSSSSDPSPLAPSPSSTSYTFQPRTPSLSFLEASQGNVSYQTFTQLLQGPCSSSGPLNKGDLFLSKHILTRALAHHYTARQHRVGKLLHVLSLAPEDRKGRNAARLGLDGEDLALAQIDWFVLLSKCCSRNPGREAFEAARWAEKEMNALRGAWEMDIEVTKRVRDIFEEDDHFEEEERKMGLDGDDPTRSPPPNTISSYSTFKGPSLDAQLDSILAQIELYKQPATKMLGYRLSALAWKDTRFLTTLLKQGRPHVYQFPDGTTIGGRLQEYSIVLAERLPAALEPRSSRRQPSSSGSNKEVVTIGAGGARGEGDFEALFAEEVRMEERMRASLDGSLSAGGVSKMGWNWGLDKGGKVKVLEGEDFDPVHPSPFRRHQMKRVSKFGRYPTVEGANDPSTAWSSSSPALRTEEERMMQPGGKGKVEELPEELKEVAEGWERRKGEVERRYGGELEEVAKGVWA